MADIVSDRTEDCCDAEVRVVRVLENFSLELRFYIMHCPGALVQMHRHGRTHAADVNRS